MIDWGSAIDPDGTGEIVVCITIGDCTYWEAGSGDLIVQREHAGRIEWTRVADDGNLDPWQLADPPKARVELNWPTDACRRIETTTKKREDPRSSIAQS